MKKYNISGCLAASLFLLFNTVNAQQNSPKTSQESVKQYYMALIKSADPADKEKVTTGLKDLSNTASEEDLILAMSLYSINKENNKSDSLLSLGVQRYPKGKLAMIQSYNKAVGTKSSAADKKRWYGQWIAKFPAPKKDKDIVYDYALSEVANAYATEKNLSEIQRWVDRIENPGYKSMMELVTGQTFLQQRDTVGAEKMVRRGVLRAKESYATSENPGAKSNYISGVASLAKILFLQGKYADAMEYATVAYKEGNQSSVQIREIYALSLSRTGKESESMPIMEELVRTGLASELVKKELKRAFINTHSSADGFEAYEKDLQEQLTKKITEDVAKQMINEESPAFTLKDLDGKTVSLAALKGKVVILDFWATWCGPCKKSFPAMQKAVHKFKDDPNVCFLFIDTWERTANPLENVKSFITENKYSFQVLLDNTTANVVGKFGISGIPAKFVIDGQGKIRFKLTGFGGGDDAAVAELSAMIENARKS